MRLSEEQQDFARDIARLITYINTYDSSRYSVTFGDAFRDPTVHGIWGEKKAYGKARSNHKRRLAVDLNLFRDGQWLADTESWRHFGEVWEGYHPHNRWGGRFEDGNHLERVWKGWR